MDKNKQLYRVNDRKVFAGVCTGIAEYFSIDVYIVRILFVVSGFVLSPVVIIVYIILAFTMPLNDDLIKNSETVKTVQDDEYTIKEDEYKIDPNDY